MGFEILGLKIIFAEVGFDTLASTGSATGLRELRSQTFGLCSDNGEENFYEVLEIDTPSFRFSECHSSKRGELIVCYFALTLMIWWRSVV